MAGKGDDDCVLAARTLYHGTEPGQHGISAGLLVNENRGLLVLVEPGLTNCVGKAPGIGHGERQIARGAAAGAAGVGKQRIPIDADKEAPELARPMGWARWAGIYREGGTYNAVRIYGHRGDAADLGTRSLGDGHDRVCPRKGNAAQWPAIGIELRVSEAGSARSVKPHAVGWRSRAP